MRRKTDRDILKENTWLICASCALIVLGIFIGLWPYLFPEPDYDALEEREVTIQALRHFSGVKGVSYDYIVTTDGERFPLPKIFLAFSAELYYTKWTPAGVMEW